MSLMLTFEKRDVLCEHSQQAASRVDFSKIDQIIDVPPLYKSNSCHRILVAIEFTTKLTGVFFCVNLAPLVYVQLIFDCVQIIVTATDRV